jgi:hypothetical protein
MEYVFPARDNPSALPNPIQAHVHTKSKLTVSDQGSKCGTTIDGVVIKGSSLVLKENEHTLQLGRYPSALR